MSAELVIGSSLYRQRVEALNAKEVPLPEVHLYRLAEESEREGFLNSLRNIPSEAGLTPWQGNTDEEIVFEALDRGVYVDKFSLQSKDLADSGGATDLSEFDSTIAEFSWKTNGRFVRALNKEPFYEVTFSRNRHLIPDEVQQALRQKKFIIAGMGVGTSVAYLLALSGAENFTVIDGGIKKPHDGNRLIGANVGEFGLNHAIGWTRIALEANPYINVECIPHNLGEGELEKILAREDSPIFFELTDDLRFKLRSRMLADTHMVTDVGFGSISHIDTRGLPFQGRWSDALASRLQNPDLRTRTEIAQLMVGPHNVPPHYMEVIVEAHMTI